MKLFLKKKNSLAILLMLSVSFILTLSGCGSDGTGNSPGNNSSFGSSDSTLDPTVKGTRDNTSEVLAPDASGTTVFTCEVATIDVSNAQEGYIMADYFGTCEKVKFQVKGPDGVTYTYNLHNEYGASSSAADNDGYEVFPLTAGDGEYSVGIYENVSGTKYSTTLATKFETVITNTFGPYLYPNQYVNFTATSLPVAKAVELAFPANTDLEVVEQVYNYIISNFTYDTAKASTVPTGYLPVVDEVFLANTGICFDYASVMATMLRTQGIPTRLEVGYMGEEYHAWISVYIEEMGWINGLIEFNGVDWNMLDPTFASSSKKPKRFITENSKYTTKYVY